jgi:hypothetical protein
VVNALICAMVLAMLAVALLTGAAVDAAQASAAVSGQRLLLACEGHCRGRTRHEDHGDGSATCTGCGTPRTTATDGA